MELITNERELIKDYYSNVLKSRKDLKESAICCTASVEAEFKDITKLLDPEIIDKSYGCGLAIPPYIQGLTVLDLGCGAGKDVYITSKLVGENGRVIGVDMTDEQLDTANRHIHSHMEKFGFEKPNVEFKKGYIEDLKPCGIPDNSVDLVISNCVINLSYDKKKVFGEIFRVLKPGGELFFSDVYADRRIPHELKLDPALVGECLAGALYTEDFRRICEGAGFPDHRLFTNTKFTLKNPKFKEKAASIKFFSRTIRAFKLDDLEDQHEDYGQVVTYLGTLPKNPDGFKLDEDRTFESGRPVAVCGNTASMLEKTRYGKFFKVSGDRKHHYGRFYCGQGDKTENSG